MGFSPKQPVPDSDYMLQRAVAESQLALLAKPGTPTEVHRRLAGAYLDRVFGQSDGSAHTQLRNEAENRKLLASVLRGALTRSEPGLLKANITDLYLHLQEIE